MNSYGFLRLSIAILFVSTLSAERDIPDELHEAIQRSEVNRVKELIGDLSVLKLPADDEAAILDWMYQEAQKQITSRNGNAGLISVMIGAGTAFVVKGIYDFATASTWARDLVDEWGRDGYPLQCGCASVCGGACARNYLIHSKTRTAQYGASAVGIAGVFLLLNGLKKGRALRQLTEAKKIVKAIERRLTQLMQDAH